VSTAQHNANLQVDELTAAGSGSCGPIMRRGVLDRRPQLDAALGQLWPGDTPVVWRLDRLTAASAGRT
jgi:DNA invertase Pin-like site-specific DNA recombinase